MSLRRGGSNRYQFLTFVSVGSCVLAASSAFGQDARVYVADSANSKIYLSGFNPPGKTLVNTDAGALQRVTDIALRDDGLAGFSMIACDRAGGRLVFYSNAVGASVVIFDHAATAGPARPDGISLDRQGNLFVLNAGSDDISGGSAQVWAVKRDEGCPNPDRPECSNGGYRTPLGLIDGNVRIQTQVEGIPVLLPAEALTESLVPATTAGIFNAGDLLVLTKPGALIRYRAADVAAFLNTLAQGIPPSPLTPDTIIHTSESSVPDDERFPDGVEPYSMAFAPSGELLVTVSDGRVLIYGPDGTRRTDSEGAYVDFAKLPHGEHSRVAVGLQDGKVRAFVTEPDKGELLRFTFKPDGTGVLDGIVREFKDPIGVDATNANTVTTQQGDNVTVAPTNVLESTFEKVVVPGSVQASVSVFPDPRESEQSIPDNLPLHRSLFLNELRADLPPIEIPAYVRAFRVGNQANGVPTFILVEGDSNVVSSGVVEHSGIAGSILGYEPACLDPDFTKQAFLFWAPDLNDPPIVEGMEFIDVSSACGGNRASSITIRGLTQNFSYFLIAVRITAPLPLVVSDKLESLHQVVAEGTCILPMIQRRLLSLIERAQRELAQGRYAVVSTMMRSLDSMVKTFPTAFGNCSNNTAGEIQARARSTDFMVSKLK